MEDCILFEVAVYAHPEGLTTFCCLFVSDIHCKAKISCQDARLLFINICIYLIWNVGLPKSAKQTK